MTSYRTNRPSELLRVDGIEKTFIQGKARKTVLSGISFSLDRNDTAAIVGPSGCGKTTLLIMIAGLIPPDEGTVSLNGLPQRGPTRKIAYVPQHYGLFPWKTVRENMLLGARLQHIAITNERIRSLEKELGITGMDRLYPRQLSGGQRQRVALARALLLTPSFLLLDEPFAAIDALTRERLQYQLLAVQHHEGFSYIIVTHNIEEAVMLGRHILVMDGNGRGCAAEFKNAGAGTRGYRDSDVFIRQCTAVRHALENAQ